MFILRLVGKWSKRPTTLESRMTSGYVIEKTDDPKILTVRERFFPLGIFAFQGSSWRYLWTADWWERSMTWFLQAPPLHGCSVQECKCVFFILPEQGLKPETLRLDYQHKVGVDWVWIPTLHIRCGSSEVVSLSLSSRSIWLLWKKVSPFVVA